MEIKSSKMRIMFCLKRVCIYLIRIPEKLVTISPLAPLESLDVEIAHTQAHINPYTGAQIFTNTHTHN